MSRRPSYEADDATWPAPAYRVAGFPGVAVYVRGWETEPDEDTVWTGQEVCTGRVVVTMVGDDRRYLVEPEDVRRPVDAHEYCGGCGQIGCGHGAAEDDEEEGA